MATMTEAPAERLVDCTDLTTREVNALLRTLDDDAQVRLTNLDARHSVGVGLHGAAQITIDGDAGYYVGALGNGPDILVTGHAGNGAGENLQGGSLTIAGDAGASLGATARGGRIVVAGSTGSRAGAMMKGGDVVVGESVGAFSAFMMQLGRLIICGDAGEHLGDSLYEGRIYVGGTIASLGADAQAGPTTDVEEAEIRAVCAEYGLRAPAGRFTAVTSMRTLYTFDAGAWSSGD